MTVDREAVAREVEFGTVYDRPRLNNQSGTEFDYAWPADRPATTILTDRARGYGLVAMPGANANRFNGATKSRNDGVCTSVEETARLQGFPPEWSFSGSRTSQLEQIGNAVPPLLQYVLTVQQLGG